MAGAIAGTAILKVDKQQNALNTVTLTINNDCNMKCSHCYLQYGSNKSLISDDVLNVLFSNKFRHLAIVGKEPLVNESSIKKICSIVEKCKEKGSSVSLVTNGVNLQSLPTCIIPQFDYIDVSFDGGIISYEKYRHYNLDKILDGINFCLAHGLKEVNALHTICDQTIDNITDSVSLNRIIPFKTILFTPYLLTHNLGTNAVNKIPLQKIIQYLDGNDLFNDTNEAMLLVDNYHIEQDNIGLLNLDDILNKVKRKEKFYVIKNDPIFYGIIRVTYDGLILSPRQSLHTALYKTAIPISRQNNLNLAFQELLISETKSYGDKKVEF